MKDQIKSFEHACEVLGRSTDVPEVSKLPEKHQKAIIAGYKLITICEAANFIANGNQPWEPDWSDWDQIKYYPWFDVETEDDKKSGSGLSYHDYVPTNASAAVGSRLCFKSSELARYIGKTFIELYKEWMLL